MAFLSKFDFEVKHIKGKENKVADALNQRTHEVYKITESQRKCDMLSRIKTTSTNNVKYGNLLNRLMKE